MCWKMAFYIKVLYDTEILQMDADFFQDDNGKIWLFYAKNIMTRPKKKSALQLFNETKSKRNIIKKQDNKV